MFIRIWSVNICKYPDTLHKLRDIKMLQKGSLENWLGSLDCHKLTHHICLHVINYHTGEVLFNVHRFLIFIFSSHYAELCKFDTSRKVGIFICTCRVLFVIHSWDFIIAHTELCVFFMSTCRALWSSLLLMQSCVYFSRSHAESCEFTIAHAESCVFFIITCRVVYFHVHMQSRVSGLLLTQSRVYFSCSHEESCEFTIAHAETYVMV